MTIQEVESESSPPTTSGFSANIIGSTEFYTPCHIHLGGDQLNPSSTSGSLSNPHGSRNSPRGQEILRFSMGRQWKTIHTVILDVMDSPIVNDIKDDIGQISVLDWEDPELDGPQRGKAINNRSGGLNVIDHLSVQPIYEEPLVKVVVYDGNGFELAEQITKDDDESSEGQCNVNDLFSQHFGNLSTALKLNGNMSSARRSLSARFVACHKHVKAHQNLFSMPTEASSLDAFISSDENVRKSSTGDLSPQLLTEPQPSDIQIQDSDKSTEKYKKEAAMDKEIENQERIEECKAALHSLDATAETILKLFAGLPSPLTGEEELSDLAAQLLPGIMEKVQRLSGLVQDAGSSKRSENKVEDFDLEPLVGRFAESLSRQVLELVRKNL